MQESSDTLYGAIVRSVLELTPLLEKVKAEPPKSLADLADKIFALRECAKRLEEMEAEVKRVEAIAEKQFIAVYLATSSSIDKVKTDFVTAEAVPKLGLKVPRQSDPIYKEVLTFLGIPKEVQDHGVVELYYPGWCSYYTSLQAKGEQVPDGIKTALTEYELSYVKTIKRKAMKGSIDVES